MLSVLAVSYPAGLALVALVALAAGGDGPQGGSLVAVAGGAAGVVALGLFYRAMAIGPMSIVAPIASMGAVVPVAVGLARGEDPGGLQLLGLAVALIGIGFAVREAEHPHALEVPVRSVVLAALAGLGFGTFFVSLDAAASDGALWATAAARAGGVGVIAAAALAAPRQLIFSRPALPALLAIAVLDTAANSLFAFASREGLLSLVAVAASLYPIATVALARVVLGERLASVQKAGVGLALVGVALIAGGG